MDEPTTGEPTPTEPRLVRAGRWFQATPAELTGLAVLLTGALAASVLLWWSTTGRPSELPNTAAQVGEVVGADRDPAEPSTSGTGGASDSGHGAPDPADPPAVPNEVTVHVTGAVAQPGVVVLPGGARVSDAVGAAGGLLPDAAPELINLARPLADGEHVHVPRPGEDPNITPRAPDAGPGQAGGGAAATGPDGRININLATAAELETLPGIGPAKAAAIVDHRETNGPFVTPGDLRNVTGIGEKTFQQLADLVSVG